MKKKQIEKPIIGIYMITNPNGQMYVGQSHDIIRRYKLYRCFVNIGGALKNSILTYGFENHKLEILKECPVAQLNKWENYYIRLYNTYNTPIGLNRKPGGTSLSGGKQVKLKIQVEEKRCNAADCKNLVSLLKETTITLSELSLLSKVTEDKIKEYQSGVKKPCVKPYKRLIAVLT